MVFWSVVLLVVAAVLLWAWRFDRRRRVRIDRSHGGLQHDIAQASTYSTSQTHNGSGSGLI